MKVQAVAPRIRAGVFTGLVWSLWAICVVLAVLALILDFHTSPLRHEPDFTVLAGMPLLVYPIVGTLIVSNRPGNAVGWVLCGMGIIFELLAISRAYADYAFFAYPAQLPGAQVLHHVSGWSVGPGIVLGAVLLVLLFPDGRLPDRMLWAVVWMAVGGAALLSFWWLTWPEGSLGDDVEALGRLGGVSLIVSCVVSVFYVFVRLQRVEAKERKQLLWFTCGASLFLFALFFMDPAFRIGGPWAAFAVTLTGLLGIPVAVGVAILRYHLYDIDRIVNRTLVYGTLTGMVVGSYALVVGVLSTVLQTSAEGGLLIPVLATGVIAVLFTPVRSRLQRSVNRLIYGERDDPYAVLSRLGERLETALAPEVALQTVVETVAQALKLPYSAIALEEGERFVTVAEFGTPAGEPMVLPLTHHSEEVGQLILSPRSPGEDFSPTDRRLLEDLARQAGAAAHAARLAADLQRSRERLVTAREEERRRLRRDLHDGLGPTLGGLTLGLDAARSSLTQDPKTADAVLSELKSQTQDAVADIRRVVHGLRPPALDDLGLVAAIQQQAARHGTLSCDTPGAPGHTNGPVFSVEAPEDDGLPPLPAAVEVACYRIAQEAITNVSRHAGARNCWVRVSPDAHASVLYLEVTDDGAGIPEDRRAGVGLTSMHERVEELGGTLAVEAIPGGGTRVLARLPLEATGCRQQGSGRGEVLEEG
jgi:signal transduction histidine kinase